MFAILLCGGSAFTPSDKAELKAATDAWVSNASRRGGDVRPHQRVEHEPDHGHVVSLRLSANFNERIGNWDVGSVTDVSYAILRSRVLQPDIGAWSVPEP